MASSSGRAPPGQHRDQLSIPEACRDEDPASLPVDKLCLASLCDGSRDQPVALLACGSFNPITNQHLRMMELARYHLSKDGKTVLGGYLSPVGDQYKKPGLVEARHRLEMAHLAVQSSPFLMVDAWEALQPGYVRTLHVLRSVREELNLAIQELGWTGTEASVVLVCGADMLESFVKPGVWVPEMLRELLVDYGVLCVAREGTDLEALLSTEGSVVHEYRNHIQVVYEPFTNVISSSKVREEVQKGRPLSYIVPDPVINFLKEKHLYMTQPSEARGGPQPA